jgi:hypothetical protein
MVEIDLDRLADAYRLRPMSVHARDRAVTSARGCSGWLLDIGGGAGQHAAAWRAGGIHPVVVDPSTAMLERASEHIGVSLIRAESERLPFRDGECGLAYFHLSIHYGDWKQAIDEAFRVVGSGGRIEVWTIAPSAIERSSLGRWFPRVIEIDTARFPDPGDIAYHCASLGGTVGTEVSAEPISRRVADWRDAVRGRFVSTLQLLDDDEIEEGLADFASEFPDEESEYPYHLELTRISTVV